MSKPTQGNTKSVCSRRLLVFPGVIAAKRLQHAKEKIMSSKKHTGENKGANFRNLVHPHPHFLMTAHKDWRVWFMVVLMLAMMGVYVMTEDLSVRPDGRVGQRAPAANLP